MTTRYEWVAEIVSLEADDEVIDSEYSDDLDSVLAWVDAQDHDGSSRIDVGLVRHVYQVGGWESERDYVYVTNGTLPDTFPNGTKVPVRLLREYQRK